MAADYQDIWNQIISHMRDYIDEKDSIKNWIEPVRLIDLRPGKATLEVQNRFMCDWIRDNYHQALRRAFKLVLGKATDITYECRNDSSKDKASVDSTEPVTDGNSMQPMAGPYGKPNPDKTFENFVVGACNEFAHGAALAVSDFPGSTYNPLFIYGSTGLGKTHLLHAIGNRIMQSMPDQQVLYVSSEHFMNEMITAIRYKRTPEFREKYRSQVQLLLVDDVQFLGKKEATQEEFFHTFETLHNSGRQIVMTSDLLPSEIVGLEDRLRSRFSSGLEADLQPPDVETMLAILQKKADEVHLALPRDVALYIASGVRSNIRELEGALRRLAASHSLYKEPLTLETVKKWLPKLAVTERPEINVEELIKAVARFHNVKPSDITGQSHEKRLVRPRHLSIYLIREHTDLSFPEIGKAVGNRDPSTIQYAYKKIKKLKAKDPNISSVIDVLERNLRL